MRSDRRCDQPSPAAPQRAEPARLGRSDTHPLKLLGTGFATLSRLAMVLLLIPAFSGCAEGRSAPLPPSAPGPVLLAEARAVPESQQQIKLSFAPVVQRTAPAVVNIFARKLVRSSRGSLLLNDPIFRQFFGDQMPFGMPRERFENSLGSGVIVSEDGMVVTNAHVIEGSTEITVVLADRRQFQAELVLVDERSDLAVLRIDTRGESLPALPLADSDTLQVGDLVLAIGNPFGVGQTVTSGIVSATARTAVGISDYNFFIQTDAAINPGNSGGALVDLDGRLVGINTAIFSRGGGGSIGIGFAVPVNMVRVVLAAADRGGIVIRPWIGVDGQPVTPEVAESLGLDRPAGVLVNAVDDRGPAWLAGLRRGDVITAVNGQTVDDANAFGYRIATLPIGDVVTLSLWRRGRDQTVRFKLIEPPEVPPRSVTRLEGRTPLAGVVVANLSPRLAQELRMESTATRGVVVMEVPGRTQAAIIGLQPGDVIEELNGGGIDSVATLEQRLSQYRGPWTIAVRRGDRVLRTTVR